MAVEVEKAVEVDAGMNFGSQFEELDAMNFSQYETLRFAYEELFKADCEPVWILNSEEVQLKEILQYYPPLPEPPKPPPPPPPPAPVVHVIRVPMCCLDCQDRLDTHLKTLSGIEKMTLDWTSEKVTIHGKEKDPITATDALSECRRIFKKSEMWT